MINYLTVLGVLSKGKSVEFKGKCLFQSAVDGKLYFYERDNEGRVILMNFDYTVNGFIE
ncbi:hypothetical protein [Crocosphaera sp.]|uniref:hypothetical protein n=1 Tax=Crocosphaera sp. TaxID=2729996 RepID=UPI00262B61B2|nr:hypothetical protein [Crocosphaera sp.]MDJ0579062.1 hypothetical protein [Crocosphaera sp.]